MSCTRYTYYDIGYSLQYVSMVRFPLYTTAAHRILHNRASCDNGMTRRQASCRASGYGRHTRLRVPLLHGCSVVVNCVPTTSTRVDRHSCRWLAHGAAPYRSPNINNTDPIKRRSLHATNEQTQLRPIS